MPSYVPVTNYRSRVDSIPGGIELSIPSRRNYLVALFLAFWLCGWTFGEVSAARQLMFPVHQMHGDEPDAFLIIWLCMWTLGGVFAVSTLLWNLTGRERIVVQDAFSIRREAFGLGWGKHYELQSVKDLRAVESNANSGPFGFGRRDSFGLQSGPLAFDYGAKTVQFGAGVDMAEAKYLVSKLIAAKPSLGTTSNRSL